MNRDDRFYAFIVARTSRSRARIRRVCVHKRWLKVSALGLFAVMCGLAYGFYGLTQQASHFRIERENQRLRAENDKQRQELQNLNNRVDAVEDTSRKLAAEVPGAQTEGQTVHGQGGPARPVDSAAALAALESKTAKLEREMRMYEAFLRQQQAIMSRPDSRPGLAAIKCPTLVLVGDGDEATPPELAREIAAAITGARLAIIADCGHLSTLEQPERVTAALVDWRNW